MKRVTVKQMTTTRGCHLGFTDTLKLKLRVLLAGHSVAIVTYCVTKIIPTCSPVMGQLLDTMTVASIDKE